VGGMPGGNGGPRCSASFKKKLKLVAFERNWERKGKKKKNGYGEDPGKRVISRKHLNHEKVRTRKKATTCVN